MSVCIIAIIVVSVGLVSPRSILPICLPAHTFDSKTFENTPKENLPNGWEPQKIIEEGRSIGQNSDKMHDMGYTGKGISVAIIDTPICMHQDLKSSLVNYEEMNNAIKMKKEYPYANHHGQAVADILVGDRDGVAPDSNLVYFATGGRDKTYEQDTKEDKLQALKEVIEFNKKAPLENKIESIYNKIVIDTKGCGYVRTGTY